ncbi:hypothetical protein PV08_03743 [Exophiala spinifera]|uniref:Alpha-carbonic anhydrase domain-containing protein n=1 Tax=Exophiala spinifera TaxID=91928 RepID=A0A0D2BD89_9EURO|nr:uncharacterized protein PV08_03743 [Exophiala spinifera]KIW16555.1 hypothetical protein PV08_03743 [Exophiala spinifera]
MLSKIFLASILTTAALGCADHSNHLPHPHARRDVPPEEVDPGRDVNDWTYEVSSDWAYINPSEPNLPVNKYLDWSFSAHDIELHTDILGIGTEYALCQNGTQQAPVGLTSDQGFSEVHEPVFGNYEGNVTGTYYNWGYGPAFTPMYNKSTIYSLPNLTFDGNTSYMVGWHTHAPAEHPVNGKRSMAEIHFVHADTDGNYAGVLAMRIDPSGDIDSPFVSQWPWTIGFNETRQLTNVQQDLDLALQEVVYFDNFWTYMGSLTVPPCKEGIRFFMAEQVLYVSNAQMQRILGMSAYSTRIEQPIWLQGVNE